MADGRLADVATQLSEVRLRVSEYDRRVSERSAEVSTLQSDLMALQARALDAEGELIAPFDPATLGELEACDKKTRHFCLELIKDLA